MYFWSLSVSFDETHVLNFESLVTDLGYQANIFFGFLTILLAVNESEQGFFQFKIDLFARIALPCCEHGVVLSEKDRASKSTG